MHERRVSATDHQTPPLHPAASPRRFTPPRNDSVRVMVRVQRVSRLVLIAQNVG